jgi:ribosome-binding ATPase YchF (GTP1/OBG family)
MKICAYHVPGTVVGKRPLKDPRLDAAHKLVEADKRTYAQVDLVAEDGLADADAIVATADSALDLILQDIEFVETRLAHDPAEAEKAVLGRMQADLEAGRCLSACAYAAADWAAVNASGLLTRKPVVVATAEEAAHPDVLLVRAVAAAGWLSFLTVGGMENRAWLIRAGTTAWEAGGAIHTDIQKGFIRAEIIGWADFIAAGGETQAKRAGKLRLEQKHYVMQDYDLVNFRFNKTG